MGLRLDVLLSGDEVLFAHLLFSLDRPGSASKELLVKSYKWGSLIPIVHPHIVVVI